MTQSIFQVIKFILMGSLAALVHGTVLYIGVSQLFITPVWANVVAFLVAFIVSFLGHSWVTFRQNIQHTDTLHDSSYDTQGLQRLAKWFTTSVLGFGLNQALFMLGIYWFGESYYLFIWFVVTAIVTVSSFLLGKFWAFKS